MSEQPGWQAYQAIRPHILRMMEQDTAAPSDYWREEAAGFDYMLDATPAIVRKLREHCHHLTGIRAYEYRAHHAHAAPAFARRLAALKMLDTSPRGLFVPESPLLGGFGHALPEGLVNIDTLKYYEALIALHRAGLFGSEINCVVEIGAGWGGLAYVWKTLFPHATYVIVDLPATLLFSATYLAAQFPGARLYLHGRDDPASIMRHDFAFLPHYAFPHAALKPNLAVNIASFQEMTSEQVRAYAEALAHLGCPSVYSLNRERSPHNAQLAFVSAELSRRYALREYRLLPTSYPHVARPPRLQALRRLLGANRTPDYRHLTGELLPAYVHAAQQ